MKRTFNVIFFCVILLALGCEKEPELSDVWIEKAQLSETYRNDPLGFSLNGKGYVGFGYIGDYPERFLDWWEYDVPSDSWKKKGDFPGRWFRDGISVATKTKGYAGLGVYIEELPDGSIEAEASKDIWEYDALKDKWTLISQFPGEASVGSTTFVIGDKIYFAGGYPPGTKLDERCKFQNELWEFDTRNNSWTQKNDIPATTGDCIFGSIGLYGFSSVERGYLLYGIQSSGGHNVWRYNDGEDSWSRLLYTVSGYHHEEKIIFAFDKIAYIGAFDSFLLAKYDLESGLEGYVDGYIPGNSSGVSWMINNKCFIFINTGKLWEYIP